MLIELLTLHHISTFVQPEQDATASAPAAQATATFDEQYAQARAWANGGQPDLALKAYSALLERSPGNADVLLGRGLVYSRTGRYAEAEADLVAATVASPTYADVWLALGNVYRWSDRPEKAVAAYNHALELRPDDVDARTGRDTAMKTLAPAPQGPAPTTADSRSAAEIRAADPEALSREFTWSVSASASTTRVFPLDQRWNDQTIGVRRYTKYGSLGVEALSASRFGQRDHAWALDGYVGLWPRAYANLRYQRAPVASLFPDNSWRAELYQGIGSGWEVSASNDTLNFDASRVRILGASVGKYVGNFYLVWRHTGIRSSASTGTSSGDRALVRYYYSGDGDNYVEAAVSSGRSDDPLSLIGGRSHSGSRSVSYVRYLTPHWGFKLGANYSREDAGGRERGMSASLYHRW